MITCIYKFYFAAGLEQSALYTMVWGTLCTVRLTDVGNQIVEIGMPVEMVTRKIRTDIEDRGMIVYGLPKGLPMIMQSIPFGHAKHPLRSCKAFPSVISSDLCYAKKTLMNPQ